MNQSDIASIAKTKFQSVFNTGETTLPFIVAGIFLLFLNVSFMKIRGIMGWSSFFDLKESLFTALYTLSGDSPALFQSFSDSITNSVSSILGGLIFGAWLIALGRYFIHSKLVGFGVLGAGLYVYIVSKFLILIDDFVDFGRSVNLGKFLDKVDPSMISFSTPVLLVLGACLVFLMLVAIKTSAYVAMRFGYAKLKETAGGYDGVPDQIRKRFIKIASIIAIPVFILLFLFVKESILGHRPNYSAPQTQSDSSKEIY